MLKTLSYLLISLLLILGACKRKDDYLTSKSAMHFMAKASHYEAIGDKKAAIREYDTLIKIEPLVPEGYYLRALADTSFNDYAGATRDINKAINLLSKNNQMQLGVYLDLRGDVKRLSGKETKAISDYNTTIQIYTRAINHYSGNDFALEERSKVEEKLKNYKQAIADIDTLIKHHSDDDTYYYHLAQVKNNEGDYHGAILAANYAVKLNSDLTFFDLGYAYYQLKDYQAAINNLSKYIAAYPKDDKAFYFRGLAKLNLKDMSGACDDWHNALANGDKKADSILKVNCH